MSDVLSFPATVPELPRLHQSIAHVLISRSPLHAWQRHKLLGATPSEPTEATDRGTFIDKMILGGGPELEVIDAPDWRTKAAQEARAAAREVGSIPILVGRYESLMETVKAIRAQLKARGLLFAAGERKVKLRWTEPYYGVECGGELDYLAAPTIYDLKTTKDASPNAIARSMVDYGYDIQHAAYRQALETLRPELAGKSRMLFLFVETEPPYALTIAEPSGTMRSLGAHKWDRACRTWRDCLASGVWPGYADDVVQIEALPWQMTQELQEEGDVIESVL
jgi:PDDEXK-like domain of unknown function (DUF3799)